MNRLTPAMTQIVKNLAHGRHLDSGFATGRSTSGGLTGTVAGLQRRGLLNARHGLTDAGLAYATANGLAPTSRV